MKADFTRQLLAWFARHGRHDLPWQQDVTPYRVWISEIMLQQTQVNTVIPYFHRFTGRFPELYALAAAELDEVLHLWTGLGYYARARNLHRAAQVISRESNGLLPVEIEALMALPGIGRSTAGAILSISHNLPHAILDGNVKRVLTRYHAIYGWPGDRNIEKQLWQLAARYTCADQAADYSQAIMDLGATVCRRSRPLCESCPLQGGCQARKQDLQTILPQKKPQKSLPVRKVIFAMIENAEGKVLLEKRPPSGIWGGLWSFPECAIDTDVSIWIKNRFGYLIENIQNEPGSRHTFSHFHLDIMPVRAILTTVTDAVQEATDLYWYKPAGDERSLGMAAPVKKLFENYFNSPQEAVNEQVGTMYKTGK